MCLQMCHQVAGSTWQVGRTNGRGVERVIRTARRNRAEQRSGATKWHVHVENSELGHLSVKFWLTCFWHVSIIAVDRNLSATCQPELCEHEGFQAETRRVYLFLDGVQRFRRRGSSNGKTSFQAGSECRPRASGGLQHGQIIVTRACWIHSTRKHGVPCFCTYVEVACGMMWHGKLHQGEAVGSNRMQ